MVACWILLYYSNANKLKIIVEEIQRKLTQAFIMHAHLDSVIIECISTVACLAEVGKGDLIYLLFLLS